MNTKAIDNIYCYNYFTTIITFKFNFYLIYKQPLSLETITITIKTVTTIK